MPYLRISLTDKSQSGRQRLLIDGVARGRRDCGLHQRHSQRRDLRLQNAAADAVHADPVKIAGYRGDQGHDLHGGIRPKSSEGQTAVFTAAPRKRYWLYGHRLSVLPA